MMEKFAYIIGDSFVNVTNIETGNSITVLKSDGRFDLAINYIKSGKFDKFECEFDPGYAVESFLDKSKESADTNGIKVFLDAGKLFYVWKDSVPQELHCSIVNRVISMSNSGLDTGPLCRFIENLLHNPDKSAIEELYLFLDACELPITVDGHFIAYKMVRGDYLDIYSGTMDNSVGKVLEMPRFAVDSNRNSTCSTGLHFCSRGYLDKYSSSNANTDRLMLVKINPADVVSIPSDYNNAKGRACRYEVVGEVVGGVNGSWRDELKHEEYTASPVVDLNGVAVSAGDHYFDSDLNRWRDRVTGKFIAKSKLSGCQ